MDEPQKPAGQRKVAAVVAGGVQRLELQAERRKIIWPPKGQPYDGIRPGAWKAEAATDETGHLPEDCPVKPLGYDGENFFFIDNLGQVFTAGAGQALGVERMQKLFAGVEDFLCWAWPAFGAKGAVSGFKAEEARRDLFAACAERGPWSPTDMVRGRGGWRGPQGELVLHCGETLWVDGKRQPTGEVGEHFYVRRPRTIEPWPHSVVVDDNPAVELVEILRSWNFVRGDTDVLLLLGWMGVALMGAALDWRPSVFIVGDAGTGKSELHRVLKAIMGRLLISTTNATSAGLYQMVGHDALPIGIDEIEGEDAPEQSQQIIKMARDAASGSVRIRGGANHQGVEFAARSTFLFSAINPPPLPPASLSRLAMLQLRPLIKHDGKAPVIAAADTIGPRLLRRIVDGWKRFDTIYDQYAAELMKGGHDSRGQKTFGTFLAAAHTLLGDEGLEKLELPFETLADWATRLSAEATPEVSSKTPNWARCIEEIMTAQVDSWNKGERHQVGQLLEEFLGDAQFTEGMVNTRLAPADLALMPQGLVGAGFGLAVPHSGKGIAGLLRDTSYAGRGANGSWRYALQQGPAGIVKATVNLRGKETNRVMIAGTQRRCTFIDLVELRKWMEEQG